VYQNTSKFLNKITLIHLAFPLRSVCECFWKFCQGRSWLQCEGKGNMTRPINRVRKLSTSSGHWSPLFIHLFFLIIFFYFIVSQFRFSAQSVSHLRWFVGNAVGLNHWYFVLLYARLVSDLWRHLFNCLLCVSTIMIHISFRPLVG